METNNTEAPIIEFVDIVKEFKGSLALDGVSFSLHKGEVHGLLGENGAGKSTLIKILTGVYGPTSGTIKMDGRPVHIHSPLGAHKLGIGAVYQDAELVQSFNVAENVLLAKEPGRLFVNRKKLRQEARALLAEVGIEVDATRTAGTLTAAEMQLVILSTLFHRRYRVLVLDEPTARLSATEAEILFRLIGRFREQGMTIIYISHRLEEIRQLCDRVTVLRGGRVAGHREREEISEQEITRLMIDQNANQLEVENPGLAKDDVVLQVEGMSTERVSKLSFAVRSGEVLGITGPVGGGMEDIGTAIAGLGMRSGEVAIRGQRVNLSSPVAARDVGVALIPEDRRRQALFNDMSVAFNLCLPALSKLSKLGWALTGKKRAYASSIVDQLDVRPRRSDIQIKYLSGGNQQKAVIGTWLKTRASVYVFIEPTAGVDVGAIKEIYEVILEMARQGSAVIVVSSAIKEILTLSETVMVVSGGEVALKKARNDTTYDELLSLAMGTKAA